MSFEASRQTYGSPRIDAELQAQGFLCSRPRVARLMKQAGLVAKMSRRFKITTRVNEQAVVAPNLLQQNFKASAPNAKWAADMSYIKTLAGWLYIDVVLDLFSRKVMGLSRSASYECSKQQNKPYNGDSLTKGCQYTSNKFQKLLAAHAITCSMSSTSNCYDNAAVESFFHTLKTECVYFEYYESREQAKQSIFEYIEIFYNNQRRHSTLGVLVPT